MSGIERNPGRARNEDRWEQTEHDEYYDVKSERERREKWLMYGPGSTIRVEKNVQNVNMLKTLKTLKTQWQKFQVHWIHSVIQSNHRPSRNDGHDRHDWQNHHVRKDQRRSIQVTYAKWLNDRSSPDSTSRHWLFHVPDLPDDGFWIHGTGCSTTGGN